MNPLTNKLKRPFHVTLSLIFSMYFYMLTFMPLLLIEISLQPCMKVL
ncbi:rCG40175, partial [Rattus norvegicus]